MQKNKLITIIILLLVLGKSLLGIRVAQDFLYWYPEELNALFDIPQLWRNFLGADGMGQNILSTAWTWPTIFVYSLTSKLGLEFSLTSKIFGVLTYILLGTFSASKFFDHLKISNQARILGSLIYLVNSYSLLLIDGGQIFIAVGYALLPLAYVYFKKSQSYLKENIFKFSLAIVLISFLEIRFLLLLEIVFTIDLVFIIIFQKQKILLLKISLVTFLAAVISLTSIHFYWLLPLLVSRVSPHLPSGYGTSSQMSLLSFASLGHALYLQQPHWPENIFGLVHHLKWYFVFFPLIAFSALFFKKNRHTLFFAIIVLISILLAKGNMPPLEQVNNFLYQIPGFSLNRDPTKYFALIALSYSALSAIFVAHLSARLKSTLPIYMSILILILIISPVWLSGLNGMFKSPYKYSEYKQLNNLLDSDKQFGRVAWITRNQPLSYSSPTHPQVLGYLQSESRAFSTATIGTYETSNYLREGEYIGQLYNIAGIKNLAYPFPNPNTNRLDEEKIKYYHTFNKQLSSLPWLK